MQTRRILKTIGLAAAAMVALSGCIKMDMHLDLQADDTVDGSMTMAVSKQLAELSGEDPSALVDQMQSEFLGTDELGDVKVEPYTGDDDFIGTTMHFTGAPLAQFTNAGDAESLSIVRDGDNFVVSGIMDLSEQGAEAGMFGDAMEVRIAVTFPGAVADHNGAIDGRTVSWSPKIGERVEMQATGSAVAGGGGGLPLLLIIGIAVAVLAVIAVVAILLLRNRSTSAEPATFAAPYGGAPAGGPGAPLPPAGATVGAPPVAVPPVAAPPVAAPLDEAPVATTPPAPAPPSVIPPAENPEGTASPEDTTPGTPPPPPVG